MSAFERASLGCIAAICFLPAGFFTWWAIVVGSNAFEAGHDNSDAVYLTIAGFFGVFALLFFGLCHSLMRAFKPGSRSKLLAVGAVLLAIAPFGELISQPLYTLNLALLLGALSVFLTSRRRVRENAAPAAPVS